MLRRCALTCHAHRIRTRARQFVACLRQVQFADVAFAKASLDQLERILAQAHRLTIQVLIRIEFAQLEVVLSHVRLQRELHRTEQCFALLLIRMRRVDVRTDAPKQVRFVRRGALRTPQGGGLRPTALRQELRGRRSGLTRRSKTRVEFREPVRASRLLQRPRLLDARRCRLQILVSRRSLLFEVIERRVAENRPPLPTQRIVRGLRLLPCARILRRDNRRFLECSRRIHIRALVRRLDGTRGEKRHQQTTRSSPAPSV